MSGSRRCPCLRKLLQWAISVPQQGLRNCPSVGGSHNVEEKLHGVAHETQIEEKPQMPGPRIVPSCHPGWGAVSDLGGSFAERGFKMGHRHSGTSNRAKTAPFQLSFHTLIFRCFVLNPSLCLLSASFFPPCLILPLFNYQRGQFLLKEAYKGDIVNSKTAPFLTY